jgi:hypothetical protein
MTYSRRERSHKSRAVAYLGDERVVPKVRKEEARRGSAPRVSKLCSGPRTKGLQRARHAVCYAVNCSCPCHAREVA